MRAYPTPMKRKHLYPVLVLLLTLAFLFFEKYINKKLDAPTIEAGATVKTHTNTYFLPTSTTAQVVHHNYYSLSYSETHEQAEWVAYELKKSQVQNRNYERPYFEVDDAVATRSAHWKNYKNSGYDRGHLCPAADREFDLQAYQETFLTSNISPQRHEFNAGIWNRLEQQVRRWAKRYDGVFVVTGGVLSDRIGVIGEEAVTVPESFYKIVYDQSGNTPKMIGFLINHTPSDKPLTQYVTAIDQIEKLTGIDFFPQLEDSLENQLEAKPNPEAWAF